MLTASTSIHRQRNGYFCGRDGILTQLRSAFINATKERTANIQALTGLGGVGKTQTAVEYVHRYFTSYQQVFWVNAASSITIDAGIVELARRMELPEARSKLIELLVEDVRLWLEVNSGWLFVLDNADEPELVHRLIVNNHLGHYLLTSRQSVLDEIGVTSPIPVGVLSVEEATAFLLNRTDRKNASDEEKHAAAEIAEDLGELPLALEQAGSYIASRKASFAGYLSAYRARKLEILAKSPPKTGDYTETVSTTWSLNLEAVREESKASATLIEYAAFLHPDDVPFELIPNGAMDMGGGIDVALKDFYVDHDEDVNPQPRVDETLIDDLLYPLIRYSLIDKMPEQRTFSIHRLVQKVIQAAIGKDESSAKRRILIKIMVNAFPIVKYEVWGFCSRLLRHAIELVVSADHEQLQNPETGTLLHRIAHYLEETGQYQLSISIYHKAVEIRESVLGQNHESTGTSLNNMGLVMYKMGYFKEAEDTLRRALAVRINARGEKHRDVGQTWNNLALALNEQGKTTESKECLHKAREILEKQTSEYDEGVLTILNNIAISMERSGEGKEAEAILRNVLSQRLAELGEVHPLVAFTLYNLASLAANREEWDDAKQCLLRALSIQEATLAYAHPDYANTCNAYANILSHEGKFEEAIKAYNYAGEMMAVTMGRGHPRIAHVLSNMGHCYSEMGNIVEAISHYHKAIDMLETRVGSNHLDVATPLNNLGYAYMCSGYGEKAKEVYTRVLSIRRKWLGPIHKTIAVVLGNLALLEDKIGSQSDAIEKYQEASSMFMDLKDPRIPDCINFLRNYQAFLQKLNRLDDLMAVTARLDALGA